MSYLEAGAGPAVVLLHAFPLNAEMWIPQLRGGFEQVHWVAPDLAGFGDTAAPLDTVRLPASIDDYAAEVEALMDALGIDRAVVGGLSMGGYVAFALWRRAASRVRALVLADTRAGADTEEGRARRRQMQALVDREGVAGLARDLLPNLLGETTRRTRPSVVAEAERLILAASPAAVKAALDCLAYRPDSMPLLPAITCPVLIVVGAEDQLTPVAESELMRARLPDARLVVVPEAGHLANLERPDAFNTALFAFLGGLTS